MSYPQYPPAASPTRSPMQHRNDYVGAIVEDVEHGYANNYSAPTRQRTMPTQQQQQQQPYAAPSPSTPVANTGGGADFSRKRSLIRPERSRINRDHPNWHYRQHAQAQGMNVYPSTTGNDPIIEDQAEADSNSSDMTDLKSLTPNAAQQGVYEDAGQTGLGGRKKLTRAKTVKEIKLEEKRNREDIRPPSLWNVYCAIITFWCPDALLRCMGMPSKAQARAWREKMGLISIIIVICAFVGFLTFGFTQVVCGTPPLRLQVNKVGTGYLIIHGQAYDLTRSHHPAALGGITRGANILFDPRPAYGGKDASFLFQNVNGHCKGLITPASGSDVPTDNKGNMAWYFPCNTFNQDGSSPANTTAGPYLGWACHTSELGRNAYYSLRVTGEVFYTWDDLRNSSRRLTVYSGSVLDLSLLNWFNATQINVPDQFKDIATDDRLVGRDITHQFQSNAQKRVARCLSEIIRVGSVDTETVGCIASKVVLYISLVFIVSIVMVKFVLALFFGWFWSWRLGAGRNPELKKNAVARRQEIEDWSDEIYRPPPKLRDADRTSKRGSGFFPTTSRFTSTFDRTNDNRPVSRHRLVGGAQNQTSTSRLVHSTSVYDTSQPRGSLAADGGLASRSSLNLMSDSGQYSGLDDALVGGFIHDLVVPQPPPDYQPFGFALSHVMMLCTAYSEGEQGLRTTLDSLATTDYPNSHKTILVICDGVIKGKGNDRSTPDIVLGMMKDFVVPPNQVQAFSYVAVAVGSKRHNMAKVYAGFYQYDDKTIPREKQQRVPMLCIVKCGTPDEEGSGKPGNRGKRDSQIILMSFLQKVMFDERMTELEFEMFNGSWQVTGISPDHYEMVLMVDADTKVFPDSLTHMVAAMVQDPEVMGLCGETKIANKRASWVSMIQVFEYFISHHLTKAFESVFGGVTCLPGCFCMYRIKAPKGGQDFWVPILANPDVVEHYSENVVDTLHKKNLLLLGEDRYLSTLMLKTFPKRRQLFVPQAVCKTVVPDTFFVLLSQRRRWINSTVHNLMELVLVRDLCGTFCFSMQFVVFIELMGTLVLPAAIAFTFYLIIISIVRKPVPVIPLILLGLILGLPAVLIVLTAHRWSYVLWMFIYLLSLPIWNLVLPMYAYWKFDDFSWGDTRKLEGEKTKKAGLEYEGEFDSSKIKMKRWNDFEKERRLRVPPQNWAPAPASSAGGWPGVYDDESVM